MAKQRRGPQSMAPSRARVVKASSAGEPQPRMIRATFPKMVLRRMVTKRSIPTLRKTKPEDAVMMGVESITTDGSGNKIANGVRTPGRGGYFGVTAVFKDRPKSTAQAKGTKRVSTPRPAPGGVRNPFRIGRGQ